jgi:epoxyqueuosine reductase
VAAGNARLDELLVPLRELLAKSKYPIVRGHAAWALGRLKSSDALQVLKVAATSESDQQVKEEINLARALSDKSR